MSLAGALAHRPATAPALAGRSRSLELPAAFQPIAVDARADAFARACRAAPRGADHGTLFWSAEEGRIRLGLVAEPDSPLPEALVVLYAFEVAIGEAVAAVLPSAPDLAYAWPGDVLAEGRKVGHLRAAAAPFASPAAVPPWLVLGLDLSLPQADPAGEAAQALAADIMARLLVWQERRRRDGFEPLRTAWNAGCYALGSSGRLWLAGQYHEGEIGGLDEVGRFRVGAARLTLESALPELG